MKGIVEHIPVQGWVAGIAKLAPQRQTGPTHSPRRPCKACCAPMLRGPAHCQVPPWGEQAPELVLVNLDGRVACGRGAPHGVIRPVLL